MDRIALGRTGLSVAPLSFGGNVFGWTLDTQASLRMLDGLADAGLNFIDTANAYSAWAPGNSGGESERIIGRWFKQSGKRDRVVLATKVALPFGDLPKGLAAATIARAVDESLKRLNTDYIDLYLAHRDDADTPLEETLQAFDTLVRAGKVRAIGASNYGAARLAQALEVSRANGLAAYATLQPEYNLYDRKGYEEELAPLCVREGLAVTGYYSLADGFLTGKYRTEKDFENGVRGPRAKRYFDARGMRIVQALQDVADQCRSTPASVALAWLMKRPGVAAPIASATSERQLAALVEACRLSLDDAARAALDEASAY